MNIFGMGWIKDPIDARDYNIRKLAPPRVALPESYIVYPGTIIYDQGSTSKCVAYASSGVKTDEEFLQWNKQYKFDSDWLYAECKKIDGIPSQEGTYPRIACQVLQTKGDVLVPSGGCIFDFAKKKTKTPDMKWAISAYYRINSANSDDEIKQVVYQYGSFLAASNWYSNWSDKFSIFPQPNNEISGGHCYRVIGWTSAGWLIANSWGTILWGDSGKAVMPYDIFRNYVLPEGDVWKIIDAV
jgi:hypothetical protein